MSSDASAVSADIANRRRANTIRVVELRRRLHREPELGWCEFQTTSFVRSQLEGVADVLVWGADLYGNAERLGVPAAKVLEAARRRAAENGVPVAELAAMDGGTGVVAELRGGRPGPTVAVRFDLDALPLEEQPVETEQAVRLDPSNVPGISHACGHDGHTAVGIALAERLAERRDDLRGTVRLLFQPAEEGTRGAAALIDAGWLEGVNTVLTAHLWPWLSVGQVAVGVGDLLATVKIDVALSGRAAHASIAPHEGANALNAAVAVVGALNALPRQPDSRAQINVGVLNAGVARNIIADSASIAMEIRCADNVELSRLSHDVERAVSAVASAFGVVSRIDVVGRAHAAQCDEALSKELAAAVHRRGGEPLEGVSIGGSDDAGSMMRHVQLAGGSAAYVLVGCGGSPLHTSRFSFDERALDVMLDLFVEHLLNDTARDGTL